MVNEWDGRTGVKVTILKVERDSQIKGNVVIFIIEIYFPGLQVYPHPDSCNHFYRCANGTLSLETCGNGLLFNEATSLTGSAHHHCSYIWQTDCGNRPNDTTPISSPGTAIVSFLYRLTSLIFVFFISIVVK